MVGEGQLGEHLIVDVEVVGGPAAVAVLHREQPVHSRGVAAATAGSWPRRPLEAQAAPSRCRRDRGRTRCGTENASRSARRPGRRICQSPGFAHFLGKQPATALPGRMVARARSASARQSWRSPCPRPARGRAARGRVSSSAICRSSNCSQGPLHLGRVEVVAQAAKRDDRVDHRREDRAQAVGVLAVREHPAVRGLHRRLPPRGGNPSGPAT